jgi:Skp family chaperone for outer membrane proteins
MSSKEVLTIEAWWEGKKEEIALLRQQLAEAGELEAIHINVSTQLGVALKALEATRQQLADANTRLHSTDVALQEEIAWKELARHEHAKTSGQLQTSLKRIEELEAQLEAAHQSLLDEGGQG